MAIWTGVRPFRFSSLNAPVSSFPNREVNKGSKGVWPAEQTQCSKLLPRWSVRFRIKVDSKPSVTSSCETKKNTWWIAHFFPCNYTTFLVGFEPLRKSILKWHPYCVFTVTRPARRIVLIFFSFFACMCV